MGKLILKSFYVIMARPKKKKSSGYSTWHTQAYDLFDKEYQNKILKGEKNKNKNMYFKIKKSKKAF
jgi:hypothetical protein